MIFLSTYFSIAVALWSSCIRQILKHTNVSFFYDIYVYFIALHRTSFHFRIELDKIEAVNMTGKTVSMSGELEDVQEYVKMQVTTVILFSLNVSDLRIITFLHL